MQNTRERASISIVESQLLQNITTDYVRPTHGRRDASATVATSATAYG